MRSDDKGVAGFFLDVPTLLVIIVAIMIFSLSLFHNHTVYIQNQKEEDMYKNLDDFISSFRSYPMIAENTGVYSSDNLRSLNESILNKSYPVESMGFEYKISISDNSLYDSHHSYEFSTAEIPLDKETYSRSTSVVIRDDIGRAHLSSLKIMIWEVGS